MFDVMEAEMLAYTTVVETLQYIDEQATGFLL